MPPPLVTFYDPVKVGLDILRGAFAVAEPTVEISAKAPEGSTGKRVTPLLLVIHGGATTRYPFDERTVLRLSVIAGSPFEANRLVGLARAYLTAHTDARIRAVEQVSGPVITRDPDTGEPIATVSVAVHARPLTVA